MQVSAEVLPDALETPDHRELAVGKMFEEAVDQQMRNLAPVAVGAESHFFEQYRTDGNQRGEGVADQQELQEERLAQHSLETNHLPLEERAKQNYLKEDLLLAGVRVGRSRARAPQNRKMGASMGLPVE